MKEATWGDMLATWGSMEYMWGAEFTPPPAFCGADSTVTLELTDGVARLGLSESRAELLLTGGTAELVGG